MHRSNLPYAILRLLKEAAYIGGGCILLGVGYWMLASLFPKAERFERTRAAHSAVGDLPVLYAGKRLEVREVRVGEHPYAFYLFVSPECQPCQRSVPFYKQLLSEAAMHSVSMAVVVPEMNEARAYVASLANKFPTTLLWSDFNLRVSATPSLVLVDMQGIVRRVWLGTPRADQAAILGAVRDPASVGPPRARLTESGEKMLNLDDIARIRKTRRVSIVSIAERRAFRAEKSAESRNIPLEELGARAAIELRRTDLNVIDCTAEQNISCSLAMQVLRDEGFEAAALDRSTFVK